MLLFIKKNYLNKKNNRLIVFGEEFFKSFNHLHLAFWKKSTQSDKLPQIYFLRVETTIVLHSL